MPYYITTKNPEDGERMYLREFDPDEGHVQFTFVRGLAIAFGDERAAEVLANYMAKLVEPVTEFTIRKG